MMKADDTVPELKREPHINMATMRSDFHSTITRLVEITAPAQQASVCTDALKIEMETLGIGINLDYAERDFQWAVDKARPLVEQCMDWWDELVNGIRYPVACCHTITSTLPGGYVSHTAAAFSVYNRDGKPIAHGVVEWADCSSLETDTECYTKFTMDICQKAAENGARSMFKFVDGSLRSSVSIAHDPEQGHTWFDERTYRDPPESKPSTAVRPGLIGNPGRDHQGQEVAERE